MKLYQRLLVSSLLASTLAACSFSQPNYSALSEVELFSQAQEEMKKGSLTTATTLFEQMDKIYPFGPYSQQVQLNLIYLYYKSAEYSLAIASIDRFLKLNPTHSAVDWVLYLRGLSNMLIDNNQIQNWFGIDPSSREQGYAVAAFKDFSYLEKAYPLSLYARDAGKRLIYLKNKLAQYHYNIVKYYDEKKAYVAVINRVKYMLSTFPDTTATRKALPLMENAYKNLGLLTETSNTQALIKANSR